MEHNWVVSSSPHIRSPESTRRIMWQVSAALAPAGLWGMYIFGRGALYVIALSVLTAVVTEALMQRLRGVKVSISDGSAFLTGLLLAYCLPAYTVVESDAGRELAPLPVYVPVVGAFVAVAIGKHAFGGLGHNIWNPALVGRAFVQISFAGHVSLTRWPWPMGKTEEVVTQASPMAAETVDVVTQATPLAVLGQALRTDAKTIAEVVTNGDWLLDMFLGKTPGSMGEVSALLLILGGLYLIIRGYVDWRIPVSYLGVVFVGVLLYAAFSDQIGGLVPSLQFGTFHLVGGGLMLGAFFMATDMVTSPLSRKGQLIFGLGCGVLTLLIRFAKAYPEGVCYAILLMNTAVPIIDRHTRPRVFGSRTRTEKDEQ